jgi:uronate dehydrogenase
MRVLITGAAGYIGRRLLGALQREHELRLGDVVHLDDPRFVPLDVTRPADVHAAMQGVEAVVHLAIAAGHEGEYEDDDFNQVRFDVNVRGTMNVLEAARRARVRRFVYTSSLMVVWGYPPPSWVPGDAPARPVGTYAVTKHLGEVLCAHWARQFGLSVVCLRIAKPIDPGDPRYRVGRIRPQWIALDDLLRAYALAVAAPEIDFEIVTLVGESSRRRWDLSQAERVLGYRPSIRLEELGFVLGEENEPYPEPEPQAEAVPGR